MATKLSEHFSLDVISDVVKGLRLPRGRFDAKGSLKSTYGVYTFAGRGGRAGKLELNRRAVSNGGFVLAVSYEKSLPGHTQRVAGEMHCRNDELGTPSRWSWRTHIRDLSGKAVESTELKKRATAESGKIEISDGRGKKVIAVKTAYTINWGLFEAVQRLPREAFRPVAFTMLDHFDQVKPGQSISYHGMIEVALSGKAMRLHRFDHLGEGIVPWVYWVNDEGRLVFALSGLEGYLLEG